MRRHHAQPLHPRLLHRYRRIKSLGHGMRDDGLALFFEERYELLLLDDQRIDFGDFAVEERRNRVLLGYRRTRKHKGAECVLPQILHARTSASASCFHLRSIR
ncbi:hypothetical protein D3C86_1569550 [compost metagenome]